jgi:glycosyltransferase involved in cell wall biosynthesis
MPAPATILKFLTKFAIGGTERQFVYVARGLDKSRFNVHVGCLSREGEYLKDIEALNIPVSEYPIKSLYSPRMLCGQWRLAQDLRRNRVQLVHAYGFYPNVFSVPAARVAGCIAIASVRDTGVFTSKVKLKTLSQKAACLLADRVIANSCAVRAWLVSLGVNESHIDVIPNGIVLDGRRERPPDFPVRREFGIDRHAPVVTVVSRLNPRKGIEYFLRAAAVVARRFPDARFLVVGGSADTQVSRYRAHAPRTPEYQSSLESLAKDLQMAGKMIFTGERSDIKEVLRETDLAVLPSLSEGMSNFLLEAMAAGLPVVATEVGGNPEIVENGKTGLLVRSCDAEALSDAMNRILEWPELGLRFGDAGYRRIHAHFSLATAVRRTEDLYASLLERRVWRHARVARVY